ncbi:MAG TPA: DUF2085 domain-containing protein [Pyrinomonadaceae bacterium]|nr:DUF2085 domain-containing protein [Pyrinomonadaceae bacterium]
MKLSAENYIPQITSQVLKKRAWKIWSVAFFIVFLWVFLILLAPIAEANGLTSVSNPVYSFFSYICHQIPSRSFHLESHAFAVCSRCFGVYFGLLLGFVVYPLFRSVNNTEPLPRFWLFAAMIPIGVDWLLGVFDIWENTHVSRFITGLILGVACAIYIIPALVEIFELLSRRKPSFGAK